MRARRRKIMRSNRSVSLLWVLILIAAVSPHGLAKTAKRKTPHPATDMVAQTFKQKCVPVNITGVVLDDEDTFILRPEFPWGETGLEKLFDDPNRKKKNGQGKNESDEYKPDKDTAYLVHVTVWKKNPIPTLVAEDPSLVLATSNWYAYRLARVGGKPGLKQWYT